MGNIFHMWFHAYAVFLSGGTVVTNIFKGVEIITFWSGKVKQWSMNLVPVEYDSKYTAFKHFKQNPLLLLHAYIQEVINICPGYKNFF